MPLHASELDRALRLHRVLWLHRVLCSTEPSAPQSPLFRRALYILRQVQSTGEFESGRLARGTADEERGCDHGHGQGETDQPAQPQAQASGQIMNV